MSKLPDFTEEEVAEIKEAFDLFDKKGDGFIEMSDMKNYLKRLAMDEKYTTIYGMINNLEKAMQGGVVNFVDFINAIQFKLGDNETGDGLARVFQLIDKNGNGVIERDDLRRVAKEIGETLSEDEIEELINDYYECPDGRIDMDSFYRMMIKNVF